MVDLNTLKDKLRTKRAEYKSLRDDYELLRQNIAGNVRDKKALRTEIAIIYAEYKAAKNVSGE